MALDLSTYMSLASLSLFMKKFIFFIRDFAIVLEA